MSTPFVPIFGYHRLLHEAAGGRTPGKYELLDTQFEQHLSSLAGHGLSTLTCHDLPELRPDLPEHRSNRVMITFDDGYASDYQIAWPLLKTFNCRATFFLTAGLMNRPGYLTWDEVRALRDAGMSIQSHSFDHLFLSTLSAGDIDDQLKKSRHTIEDAINTPVEYLAVPGGRISPLVIEVAREAGYKGVFTSRPGYGLRRLDGIDLFERFIIHQGLPPAAFLNIARQHPGTHARALLTYAVKGVAKRLLGR